jgi:hypothetical protein
VAVATTRAGNDAVLVLGAYTGSLLTSDTRELLSIEKPKTAPPTAKGSIVRNVLSGSEAHLIDGRWLLANSGYTTQVTEWPLGFEVIRDAGAEKK